MYDFNQIDENNIQIYGSINGYACRSELNGAKVWNFSISFFKGPKQFKISSNRDGTMWNVDKLKERIKKAYEEE